MLMIADKQVRMIDGLYSLNDLHRASGGNDKHKPANFIRLENTQELINELIRCSDMSILEPVRVIKGIQPDGAPQGTFVCRELVYSYAMWISPRFQLLVIRAFDAITNQRQKLSQQLNDLCRELSTVDASLTIAGRFLCVAGKQVKPQLKEEIGSVLDQMQPSLDLLPNINPDNQGG